MNNGNFSKIIYFFYFLKVRNQKRKKLNLLVSTHCETLKSLLGLIRVEKRGKGGHGLLTTKVSVHCRTQSVSFQNRISSLGLFQKLCQVKENIQQ